VKPLAVHGCLFGFYASVREATDLALITGSCSRSTPDVLPPPIRAGSAATAGLDRAGNQREWPLILDAACNAYALLLVAVVRVTSLVNSDRIFKRYREADENGRKELHALWVAATAQLRIYGSSQRMDLDRLKQLTPAVQNRGTLWRITRNLEVGVIDPNVSPVHHGGEFQFARMSVTVCSKEPGPRFAPRQRRRRCETKRDGSLASFWPGTGSRLTTMGAKIMMPFSPFLTERPTWFHM
jgi:hypothetical protein